MATTESSDASSPPLLSETSHGSSVSSDFQKEYEDILKYALVTPRFEAVPSAYVKPAVPHQDYSCDHKLEQSPVAETSSCTSNSDENGAETEMETVKSNRKRLSNRTKVHDRGANQRLLSTNAKSFKFPVNEEHIITEKLNHNDSSASSTLSNTSLMNGIFDGALDGDLGRMDNLLDVWCLELKRNILGEFSNNKLKLLEHMKEKMEVQEKRHLREEEALQDQIEKHKELLHTFEKSINQKDLVITNLTDSLEKQKEKQEKLKILLTWKLKHNDEKRERFASKLAEKHYKRTVLSKIWLGWRSVIEMRWKQRVERACQSRSQEICVKLTEDYEERLKGLQNSLEVARIEVARLHNERDLYEETMKKAFMRGVCALNLEAMHMFREQAYEEEGKGRKNENGDEISDSGYTAVDKQKHDSQKDNRTTDDDRNRMKAPQLRESNFDNVDNRRKIAVSVVGKDAFRTKMKKQTKAGKQNSQPSITSVFVEKHKADEARDVARAKSLPIGGRTSVASNVPKPKSNTGRGFGEEIKVVL
ncbi:centrosomal protein POC5-like isoform X2 [Rhopilema esculentum]|uniref:centrosomal protein POC5-like isoform X2 n=1 Tax=Rhopilema esculentum TaxID=499914 RepID=UPI0031D4DCE0